MAEFIITKEIMDAMKYIPSTIKEVKSISMSYTSPVSSTIFTGPKRGTMILSNNQLNDEAIAVTRMRRLFSKRGFRLGVGSDKEEMSEKVFWSMVFHEMGHLLFHEPPKEKYMEILNKVPLFKYFTNVVFDTLIESVKAKMFPLLRSVDLAVYVENLIIGYAGFHNDGNYEVISEYIKDRKEALDKYGEEKILLALANVEILKLFRRIAKFKRDDFESVFYNLMKHSPESSKLIAVDDLVCDRNHTLVSAVSGRILPANHYSVVMDFHNYIGSYRSKTMIYNYFESFIEAYKKILDKQVNNMPSCMVVISMNNDDKGNNDGSAINLPSSGSDSNSTDKNDDQSGTAPGGDKDNKDGNDSTDSTNGGDVDSTQSSGDDDGNNSSGKSSDSTDDSTDSTDKNDLPSDKELEQLIKAIEESMKDDLDFFDNIKKKLAETLIASDAEKKIRRRKRDDIYKMPVPTPPKEVGEPVPSRRFMSIIREDFKLVKTDSGVMRNPSSPLSAIGKTWLVPSVGNIGARFRFIIDVSGSVFSQNYSHNFGTRIIDEMMYIVNGLLKTLKPFSLGFYFTVFADDSVVVIDKPFNDTYIDKSMINKLASLVHNGVTNTPDAIYLSAIDNKNINPSRPWINFVISDGEANATSGIIGTNDIPEAMQTAIEYALKNNQYTVEIAINELAKEDAVYYGEYVVECLPIYEKIKNMGLEDAMKTLVAEVVHKATDLIVDIVKKR